MSTDHLSSDSTPSHEQQLHALRKRARGRELIDDYARQRIVALPRSDSAIAYFEMGDPNGTPLLCLHGLSVSGFFFAQYHAYFVRRGIRAIAPCLLGGVYLADGLKTIDQLSAELVELLDILDIHKFDMVGFSWGTLPQLALIARVPQRIRRAGLLGAMLPQKFIGKAEIAQLKSDVRQSLKMVAHAPRLHRHLMWLLCKLPVSVLMEQFRDEQLSAAEAAALEDGSVFSQQLAHCMQECQRTGSRFFTDGWRMFLDEPGYALDDLAALPPGADLRLYVAERDNVHLPVFSRMIASACPDADVARLKLDDALTPIDGVNGPHAVFRPVYSRRGSSILVAPNAGRMACMLYLTQALDNLIPERAPERQAFSWA